jgi:hypothetical protein
MLSCLVCKALQMSSNPSAEAKDSKSSQPTKPPIADIKSDASQSTQAASESAAAQATVPTAAAQATVPTKAADAAVPPKPVHKIVVVVTVPDGDPMRFEIADWNISVLDLFNLIQTEGGMCSRHKRCSLLFPLSAPSAPSSSRSPAPFSFLASCLCVSI